MTDLLHPLDEHGLPRVLKQARALAAGPAVDTEQAATTLHLFDVGGFDRVLIEGRDRIRFLHAMLSNDIQSLGAGEGRWATLNSVQGKTISDVRVFILDEEKKTGAALALLEPGAGERFVDTLDRYIIADKVHFSPDEGHGLFLLTGPGAEATLTESGATLPEATLYSHTSTELGGAAVRLFRLDRTGEAGQDLAIRFALEDEERVRRALQPLTQSDPELLEALRIEGGQPRYGIDFTSENIPLEAGLKDLAISFTKGCYIGQEVICRIDSMGSPKRRLVTIHCDGDQTPLPGTALLRDGKAVGHITSSVPTARGPRALGYVKKRHNEPGTELRVGREDGPTARVGQALGRI